MGTFISFLQFGKCEVVSLDSLRTDIECALGVPGEESTQRRPFFVKYGSLEIVYDNPTTKSKVTGILLRAMTGVFELPPAVHFTDFSFSPTPSFATINRYLAIHGKQLIQTSNPSDHISSYRVSDLGTVLFDTTLANTPLVGVSIIRPDQPHIVQISISLPTHQVEAIRKIAAQQRESLSTVCARLVAQALVTRQENNTFSKEA